MGRITQPSGRPRARTKTPTAGMKVTVHSINVPGYSSAVNGAKYEAMRAALLRVLPRRSPGITQAEMFRAVVEHLPEDLFPGGAKSNWWAKTVQLDLEAKRIVRRSTEETPLRWFRLK